MNKLMLFLILCLNLAPLASALPEEGMFGVEQDSLEWKRAELEEFIVFRTTRDLTPFIPQDKFRVQAQVTFKEATPSNYRPPTNVNIPLLGTVAQLVQGGERPQPKQGLFNKVARLDLTLIVAAEVEQSTVDSMSKLMLQKVPVLKKDKVFLEVVRFKTPGLGAVGWIREFKGLITALCLVSVLLIGLFFTMPKLRFQTYVKVGPVPRADGIGIAPIFPGFTNLQQTMLVPANAGDNLGQAGLPQTINATELKRLRSAAMTLSIADCIDLIKTDSRLGSILVSLLPQDKATRVVAQLPEVLRKELTMKTLEWTAESLIKNSEALMAAMQKFRGSAHLSKDQSERLSIFVDQVGPENEEAVFGELVRMQKFEELKLAVRQSPPASLIAEFPMDILAAAFERLSFHERACLVATCENKLAERVCPAKSRDPMHVNILMEVEYIRKDPIAMAEGNSVWPRFVVIVREALQKNPKFMTAVAPHINDWLWHRSNGVVGAARSGKTKKSDEAA